MQTILAAANQTYAKTSFRVFVLDDGRTKSLRKAVEDLNSNIDSGTIGLRPVVYLARDKDSGLTNYKSGNLHFGLEHTLSYDGGSQYVAALDADMVPERDWLARTVLPLQEDSNVAMAGPPQHFRNVPADDLLGQDTGAFREIFEPLRDRFGFSQCCGSGYVVRREALDSIGGWPLCNVGEDIVCSCTLMEAGWKTAYVNAELQCGVVADSFHAYVAQRVRWVCFLPSLVVVERWLLIDRRRLGPLSLGSASSSSCLLRVRQRKAP
jgi:cellulose synthase/poly-beta-1,6-N-acetylglucosamine synthase-like glycosyltransferase